VKFRPRHSVDTELISLDRCAEPPQYSFDICVLEYISHHLRTFHASILAGRATLKMTTAVLADVELQVHARLVRHLGNAVGEQARALLGNGEVDSSILSGSTIFKSMT
jgi:hypothetical protein